MEKTINPVTAKKLSIMRVPTASGECYQVGNAFYLYTKNPLKDPNDIIRDAVDRPNGEKIHNQTEKMRRWVDSYNMPSPRDTGDLYNYVFTVGEGELPTHWPALKYMQHHSAINPSTLEGFAPHIVYPHGTHTMCRFGHIKKKPSFSKKDGPPHLSCYRCAYWRQQGVDLTQYKPTHCLNGHPLKDNRWLTNRRGKVSESCVKCNNEAIINATGYQPQL